MELIEAGEGNSSRAETLLQTLLGDVAGKLDALVLGCTHYPFAREAISRVMGDGCLLLDGGEGTARETRRRLEQAGLLRQGEGQVILENTKDDPRLLELCHRLLYEEG